MSGSHRHAAPRCVDVLIIGAGQAGLGTAYWLTRTAEVTVLILDATTVGQSWLQRWDSLTLFTPRRFSSLPGLPFPPGTGAPTRREMADYLQRYVQHFGLPVETGQQVHRLRRTDDGSYLADTPNAQIRARHVVLATGPFHQPHLPPASRTLDPAIPQLHSSQYHRPTDLTEPQITIVGGGNSAAQLAVELASTHQVTLVTPGPPWYLPDTVLGISMYWWIYLMKILNAPTSASVSRYIRRRGDAIVGNQLRRHIRRGQICLIPHRVLDATGGNLLLANGTNLTTTSVLWCTGFEPDTTWIDVPQILEPDGHPIHHSGTSPSPGLHWMGLPWQTRLNSSIIDGIDRDAHATATRILTAIAKSATTPEPRACPS